MQDANTRDVYAFLDWAVVRTLSLPELGRDGYIGRVMQSRISVNPYGVEVSEDRRRRGSFEIFWLTDGLIAIYNNLFTFKFSLVSQSHIIQAFDRRTGPFDFTWLIHSPVRLATGYGVQPYARCCAHVDRHMTYIYNWTSICFGLWRALDCLCFWDAKLRFEGRYPFRAVCVAHLCLELRFSRCAIAPHSLSLAHPYQLHPIEILWYILISFACHICHMHDSYWFILIHVVSPRGLAKSPEERRFLQGLAAIASPARCLDLLRQHGSLWINNRGNKGRPFGHQMTLVYI